MMRVWPAGFVLVLIFAGCVREGPSGAAAESAGEHGAVERDAGEMTAARREAARIAALLDDRLLAAQVIFGGLDGNGVLGTDMRAILEDCPPGGILLFRYNLNAEKDQVRAFLAECAALAAAGAGVPPFVAVDHEGGPVFRFGPGVAPLPAAGSYGELARRLGRDQALRLVEEDARRSALEIRDLGITLNFAPLAEPLTAGNRAFLADRSYEEDPAFVEAAAAAFVRGMTAGGVGCAVKHFPGTAGDPHLAPSTLAEDREGLAALTGPFANLIRAGLAPALMVSHARAPARDGEIASLSPVVVGEWLRGELGFDGLVIADDFSMAAAAASGLSPEAAAVKSLAAGTDMVIVWPGSIRRTRRALLAALEDGALSRERLREAAERIIREKLRLGIMPGK